MSEILEKCGVENRVELAFWCSRNPDVIQTGVFREPMHLPEAAAERNERAQRAALAQAERFVLANGENE